MTIHRRYLPGNGRKDDPLAFLKEHGEGHLDVGTLNTLESTTVSRWMVVEAFEETELIGVSAFFDHEYDHYSFTVVALGYRGKHVGRRLLNEKLDWWEHGRFTTHAAPDNYASRRIIELAGFKEYNEECSNGCSIYYERG